MNKATEKKIIDKFNEFMPIAKAEQDALIPYVKAKNDRLVFSQLMMSLNKSDITLEDYKQFFSEYCFKRIWSGSTYNVVDVYTEETYDEHYIFVTVTCQAAAEKPGTHHYMLPAFLYHMVEVGAELCRVDGKEVTVCAVKPEKKVLDEAYTKEVLKEMYDLVSRLLYGARSLLVKDMVDRMEKAVKKAEEVLYGPFV